MVGYHYGLQEDSQAQSKAFVDSESGLVILGFAIE
jgi:hypothetical protein